jgi:hypothetical protein
VNITNWALVHSGTNIGTSAASHRTANKDSCVSEYISGEEIAAT